MIRINLTFILSAVIAISEIAYGNEDLQKKYRPDTRSCREHVENIDLLADCIETGVYDPCDEGSTASISLCYTSHSYVASRRIERAEKAIRNENLGQLHPFYSNIDSALLKSHKEWESIANNYCKERDHVFKEIEKVYGIQSSYPDGVDTGQGFNDCIVQAQEEWARELESFVVEFSSKKNQFRKDNIAARLNGFLLGNYPLFQRKK